MPTEFQYVTEHAETPDRLVNQIYSVSIGGLWSVADGEGENGLPYRTEEDARVAFLDAYSTSAGSAP